MHGVTSWHASRRESKSCGMSLLQQRKMLLPLKPRVTQRTERVPPQRHGVESLRDSSRNSVKALSSFAARLQSRRKDKETLLRGANARSRSSVKADRQSNA